jgi:molecular chaperone GrpE
MHDQRDDDFQSEIEKLGDDEIEIEFVDVDEETTPAEPPVEAGAEVAKEVPADSEQAAQLKAELEHVRDMYLRKLAEFDNFRKRVEREREENRQLAVEDFIRDLLPVIDNFERALEHAGDDSGGFFQGVEMIAKQLVDLLARRGISEINPLGETFDPERHEAVQRVEDGEHPPGTVVFVMLKGYQADGRLIRPALVGVAVETQGGNGSDGGTP